MLILRFPLHLLRLTFRLMADLAGMVLRLVVHKGELGASLTLGRER